MKTVFLSILFISSLWSAPIDKLLEVMEVPHDGTVESIVKETQARWLRPAGKERWEVEDTLSPAQRKAVFEYCLDQGFFDEIKPSQQSYDYALVMGATVFRMQARLDYLAKLIREGFEFKQVVLLTGARPLDPSVEIIPPSCKTEGDAMAYLWENHPLSKQVSWKQLDHPMIEVSYKTFKRPSAEHNLRLWLRTSPEPGSCIIVANQPYQSYYQAVAKHILPQELTFEAVSPSLINAAVLLDNLARVLYESNKLK